MTLNLKTGDEIKNTFRVSLLKYKNESAKG